MEGAFDFLQQVLMSAAHDFDLFILSLLTFPNEKTFSRLLSHLSIITSSTVTYSTPSLTPSWSAGVGDYFPDDEISSRPLHCYLSAVVVGELHRVERRVF